MYLKTEVSNRGDWGRNKLTPGVTLLLEIRFWVSFTSLNDPIKILSDKVLRP